LAIGYKAKKELYDRLLKEDKEGIVFKRLNAIHTPGRPASYGDMLKFKFYSTASVRVAPGREGKRSIGMEVLDGNAWTFVGNCTIPPNKEIPEIGCVVEVRMLYYNKGGSIYQPTYLGLRDDTEPKECIISQLKCKPKLE
jgi:bifunctional non-homologous end joining protein LigD